MRKAIPCLLLLALVPWLGACLLFPPIFGPPPSLDGQWRVEYTFSAGGTSVGCVDISGQRIVQTGNCGGTPDTITDQPVAITNGNHIMIEQTISALGGGASLRTVFDLNWQVDGSLVGTASATLNAGAPTVSNVVWRRR